MLGKLIKYEFKATYRFMLMLYALLMSISVLTAVMCRIDTGGEFNIGTSIGSVSLGGNSIFAALEVILIMVYAALNIAAVSSMFFFAVIRFHRNLLGNEGYLMHTLPVTQRDNILAKTFVSVIWTLAGFAAVIISGLIIAVGVDGADFFADIYRFLCSTDNVFVFKSIRFILICAELMLLFVAALINGYLHIYASMAAGYSLSKYRNAASVGVFIVLNVIQSLLCVSFNRIFTNFHSSVYMMMAENIIFFAAASLGFYFITKYFISRKLNLQ